MTKDSDEKKYQVLVQLYYYLTIGQTIIFVRRRDIADEIAKRMTAEGHTVTVLHAGQEERDENFERFRRGSSKVLITTNLFSRGLDQPAVVSLFFIWCLRGEYMRTNILVCGLAEPGHQL